MSRQGSAPTVMPTTVAVIFALGIFAVQVSAAAAASPAPDLTTLLPDGLLGALILWLIARTFGQEKRRGADHEALMGKVEKQNERYLELKVELAKLDGRLDEMANTMDDHSRRFDEMAGRLITGLGQQDAARHNLRNEIAALLGASEERLGGSIERVEKRVVANESRLNDVAERRSTPR